MDANTLATFGIAGIVLFAIIGDRVKAAFRSATPVQAAPITEATISEATEAAPLSMRAWLDYVNAQPDAVPHLAVIGPSGAGKTALATVALTDRPGQIVVITAKEGDHWGLLPYISIDLDASYTTANDTFTALEVEVKRRLIAVKQRRMTADYLTIVVDDFSTLVKECPVAANVVKLVARLGRSLRVRLLMLSDSALVKAIGLEGEGETRANFAFVQLVRGHKGTLEIEGSAVPIDTSLIKPLSERANLTGRAWRVPRDAATELNDWLGLSAHSGAFSSVEIVSPASKSVSAVERHETRFEIAFSARETVKIVAAIARNESQTAVVKSMPGYRADRHAVFVAKYAELKEQVEGE